jgi:hypothetical protein
MNQEESKICNKCNIAKPFFEFHKDKNSKDGLRLSCKDCIKQCVHIVSVLIYTPFNN